MLRDELALEPEEKTRALYESLLRRPSSSVVQPTDPRPRGALSLIGRHFEPRANPPLIGRQLELARLEATMVAAWEGSGTLVVLRGESGVGKTRLLEALAVRANERGGRTVRGRCFESEQVFTLSLWIDLLQSEPALFNDALWKRIPSVFRDELARILPAMTSVATAAPRASGDARPLFEAIGEVFKRGAQSQPLLVVLEDLQWADALSLRLLSFFARRALPAVKLCLMASVREEALGNEDLLREILREIDREGHLAFAEVLSLSRSDTLTLFRSLSPRNAPEAAFEHVWALSEGNPWVVVESVRHFATFQLTSSDRPAVPERVREIILAHVAARSADARALITAAAVIGRQFELDLLRLASDLEERALLAALEELVCARLLQCLDAGFYFTHDRVREVVYSSLLEPHRRRLHGRVARALERHHEERPYDASGPIGYHLARSGDAAESIAYLLRFVEHAELNYGLEEALTALAEAERQTAGLPGPQRDACRVDLAVRQARCLFYLGRASEMEPVLTAHRETVARLPPAAHVTPFYVYLAMAHAFLGNRRGVAEQEARLLAAVERSEDPSTIGLARAQLSYNAYRAGRFREGIDHGARAIAHLEHVHEPELTALAWMDVGACHVGAGNCRAALEHFARAEAIGEQARSARIQSMAKAFARSVTALMGEHIVGLEACRDAVRLAPDPYSARYAHWCHVRVAAGAASFGVEFDRTVHHTTFHSSRRELEAWACSEATAMHGWAGLASLALAEADVATGDATTAALHAERSLEALGAEEDPLGVGWSLRVLGRAELALGRLDSATAHIERAERHFEELGARFDLATTVLFKSALAAAGQDQTACACGLERAHMIFRELELPWWMSLIRGLAGASP